MTRHQIGILILVSVLASTVIIGACRQSRETLRWIQAVTSALQVRAHGEGETDVAVSTRYVYARPSLDGSVTISVDGMGTIYHVDKDDHLGPWCLEVVVTAAADQAQAWLRVEGRDARVCEQAFGIDTRIPYRVTDRADVRKVIGPAPDGARLLIPRDLLP
jgi:hypothetical protein